VSPRLVVLTVLIPLAAACAPAEPDAPELAAASLERTPELVETGTRWAPPQGADGAPQVDLAWRDADGTLRAWPDIGPIVTATPCIDGALGVAADGTLWWVGVDGRAEVWDHGVTGTPAVSPDGAAMAWVTRETGLVQLRTNHEQRTRETGLETVGLLRFSPDGAHVLLVGASSSGVAGVHALSLAGDDGARCLSNCQLRAGQPWGAAFVPPPRAAADLVFDGSQVRWSVDGRTFAARWRRVVP